MAEYGGIAKVMPLFAACFVIITFSSVAVPGTNGFIGEFLVLLGTFKSGLSIAFGAFAALGVILGAAYMLWMVQKVFFGALTQRENLSLRDLSWREGLTVAPFILLVLVMGTAPQPFLDRLAGSTQRFVARASFGAPGSKSDDGDVLMRVMPAPASTQTAALPLRPSPLAHR
jgi:NADH-quinone oxidoreductase subunit M